MERIRVTVNQGINMILRFLCRIGLHHKKLVKHFISEHKGDNTYSLDYLGYECLRCRHRFVVPCIPNNPLLHTIWEVDYWANQRSRSKKSRSDHLKLLK